MIPATFAIARRELVAYTLSPVGYLITALFLFFTSLIYFTAAPLLLGTGFSQGEAASLRVFFLVGVWVFFVIGPAISMGTISEELRLGTLEMLMTAPVNEAQVIIGKFLGSLGFLVLMLLPTLLFVVALEIHGRPDYGEIICGYIGVVLIGAAFLATGVLFSSLTSSQVLAYVATIFFWLILLLTTRVLPFIAQGVEDSVAGDDGNVVLQKLSGTLQDVARLLAIGDPMERVKPFVNGLLDSFNVIYFLTFVVVFLLIAIRSLELRRWP